MSDYNNPSKERLFQQLIQEVDAMRTPDTCNAKTNRCNDSLKKSQCPKSLCICYPLTKEIFPPQTWCAGYLAVLSSLNISNSESRDTVFIWLGSSLIESSDRSIASKLGVHANDTSSLRETQTSAVLQIIDQGDTLGKVGAGVQGARSLPIIQTSSESMLEYPVGAALWAVEALSCAVAGRVDAVFEVQVDHGDNAGDVDAFEVAYAAAVIGGSLQLGEFGLGDFSLADGPVVVFVSVGEDVDVAVGVVVCVAAAEAG